MQTIIKTFDIIVKFNTFIKNQVYTDSMKLHQHAVYVREFYQALITCVMRVDENFIKIENENHEQYYDQLIRILKNESENISKHEIELTQAIISVQQKRRIKFIKLLKFSNVHVDLHLTDNAKKYAIVINFNVLIEEFKHKYSFHDLNY